MKQIIRRFIAVTLVFTMLLSTTACMKKEEAENPTSTVANAEAPTDITLNLHYLRDDNDYTGWNVWLWTTGDGKAYQFDENITDTGAVTTAHFNAGTKSIGFIVRLNEWEAKDVEEDQFIDTSSILAGTVDVYVNSGNRDFRTVYSDNCVTGVGVSTAFIDSKFTEATIFITEYYTDDMKIQIVDKEHNEIPTKSIELDERNKKKLLVTFKEKIDVFGTYYVCVNDQYYYDITIPDFYVTEEFEGMYDYEGNDLGATYSQTSTCFKVWAPTADSVNIRLYDGGDIAINDMREELAMTKGDKGVWSLTVDGNLAGTYYTYYVNVGGKTKEACDPYARAVGVNGERAMVIDLAATNPDGWDIDVNPHKGMNYTDASIYELHIRDLSSDASSGIVNTGKYLGLTETGTHNTKGVATGLDHIVELGVTHVQLNPVYDFATVDETKLDIPQYNWGYDPKNYNVPEGSYSTNPYDGAVRVTEFKQMVKALHDNGLSVVMDVVYNHTYSTDFCFNRIVPGYFHRPNSNGSGCGNDVASERDMVRKYIVDSVVYWAKEYHIDGFRFDLVGLIDTETVKAIRAALDEIDPSIILYGEGWNMSTTATKEYTYMATQNQVDGLGNFAMFNDTIRDALKGSVFTPEEKGFINGSYGKTSTVMSAISGLLTWTHTPYRMINYVSCHDNLTIWDEINTSNAEDTLDERINQDLMAAAIVFTSQGIPFMLAGDELLRSKSNEDGTFNNNSYNAPDSVNSIKWDSLSEERTYEVYEYYKGMIAFRKAHSSFRRMETRKDNYNFIPKLGEGIIAYTLVPDENDTASDIMVIHNASRNPVTVDISEGEWTVYVEGRRAGTQPLRTVSSTITVEALTSTILLK